MNNLVNRLNLNSLYHFHIIAQMRSLKRASEVLNLSAPAVTHSLNNVEDAIGDPLCVRNRGEFSLTPTGQELFRCTQNMFKEMERFSARNESDEDYAGIFSIGILDHFEEDYFVDSIKEVVSKFPKVKLNIQAYDSETLNKLLLEKEIDVAFGIFSSRSPRIKYIKTGEERMRYYISKNHSLWQKKKITKDDLVGQKVAWIDNHGRKKFDLESNIFVDNPKYKMQFYGFSNNLSGALAILLSGHAVVPLSENIGEQLSKVYPIKKLEFENRGTELIKSMAFNPTAPQSPALKFFLSILSSVEITK
jgi:DNA-binding transcriptional LysR family regulator